MTRVERFLAFLGVDVAGENVTLRALISELRDELDRALTISAGREAEQIGLWRAKVRMLESHRTTLYGDLEEANSRINALLEQLRVMKSGGTQLALSPGLEVSANPPVDESDEMVSEIRSEFVYQIIAVYFLGKHFWTLQRGDERINDAIHDKEFLEQMAQRKVFFAAGDALRAEFVIRTFRTPRGEVYAKHSIERVIGVLPPEQQTSFQPPLAAVPQEQGV